MSTNLSFNILDTSLWAEGVGRLPETYQLVLTWPHWDCWARPEAAVALALEAQEDLLTRAAAAVMMAGEALLIIGNRG